MSSQPIPTLGYWKIRCLGQPIRCLLEYLGVEYEDKYYLDYETWYEAKAKLPVDLPNLPYWIDGDKRVTESRAIMRHLCREKMPALLGETDEIKTKVEMLENFIWDFWVYIFLDMLYLHTETHIEAFNKAYPVRLGLLSKLIGENTWCTGEKLTYVDFWVYEALYHFKAFDPKSLSDYPNLEKMLEKFEQLPAISVYMKSPSYMAKPCISDHAIINI